jgi:hypothetical protein
MSRSAKITTVVSLKNNHVQSIQENPKFDKQKCKESDFAIS